MLGPGGCWPGRRLADWDGPNDSTDGRGYDKHRARVGGSLSACWLFLPDPFVSLGLRDLLSFRTKERSSQVLLPSLGVLACPKR